MQKYFSSKPVATLTKPQKLEELDYWQRQFTAQFLAKIEQRPGLVSYVVPWAGAAVSLIGGVITFVVDPIIGPPVAIAGVLLAAWERFGTTGEKQNTRQGYSSLLDWRIRDGMSLSHTSRFKRDLERSEVLIALSQGAVRAG